jgi:hypothetical protein
MAASNGTLVQALIDGGLQPAAARVIANALANASTPQFSQSQDLSDQTPTQSLRMIDRDARKYQFANLDYSSEEPYERRLRGTPGRFAADLSDHPYKNAQPVVPVPPLSKASIAGGDYIGVDHTVRDGAPLATVGLKLNSRAGKHLRANPATNAVDAVQLEFASPQGLVTADVSEDTDATRIELAVRGLRTSSVVQSDGTSRGVLSWTDASSPSATIFTPWIQQNILSKNTAADVLSTLGAPAYSTGAWTPVLVAIGAGAVNPTVTYNAAQTVGRWTKIGELVQVTGRISLSSMASPGNGIMVISGLPFTILAGQPGYAAGNVSFKSGWTTQGPESCYAEQSTDFLVLSYHTATAVALMSHINLSATADVIFSCEYRTAQ